MMAQECGLQWESSKRSAEDACHVTDAAHRGGVQPDPGSTADDSMQDAMRDAGALGADAVALACKIPATSWCVWLECRRGDGSAVGKGCGAQG